MFISPWKPNSPMRVFSVISGFSSLGDEGTQACSFMASAIFTFPESAVSRWQAEGEK